MAEGTELIRNHQYEYGADTISSVDTTPLTKKQCPLSDATTMAEGKSLVEY
jgi:hypothetical protein